MTSRGKGWRSVAPLLKTRHSYLIWHKLRWPEPIGAVAPLRPFGDPATSTAPNWSVQLTFPAPLWSHNVLWCLMSSFSIHFHPLQEASYNADRVRHTTAAGQREENSKTEKKRKKKHWIVLHNYLLLHHMSKYTFDLSRFDCDQEHCAKVEWWWICWLDQWLLMKMTKIPWKATWFLSLSRTSFQHTVHNRPDLKYYTTIYGHSWLRVIYSASAPVWICPLQFGRLTVA